MENARWDEFMQRCLLAYDAYPVFQEAQRLQPLGSSHEPEWAGMPVPWLLRQGRPDHPDAWLYEKEPMTPDQEIRKALEYRADREGRS